MLDESEERLVREYMRALDEDVRPERVLLVRLSAMGDIVHTMPSAVAIKGMYPEWKLDWVVQSNFADLLRGHPAIDTVIEVPRRPSRGDLSELRARLRAERYTVALDMQGLFKSGRIAWLSGARRRLGFHWQREFSRLFSRPVAPREPGLHVVEQYLAVAEALIWRGTPVEFGLRPLPEALQAAAEMLEGLRLEGRPLAINLGAGKPQKRWPLPRFAELVPMARERGWSPFVIGGPSDIAVYEEFCSLAPGPPPSLAGRTSVAELVALLSLAEAHVGGDTGSIHIAAALGKPVVAVMGPTDPARSGPYGRREFTLYKGPEGLADIEAWEVVAKLQHFA